MGNKGRVYIVDDDVGMRDSLGMLLRAEGYDVDIFPSADAFLDAVKQQSCTCLVTDLRMPGLSGLGLQRELQNRGIGLPVIFITGHGDVSSAVQAMKHGALDFLEKPFSNDQLLERIQSCLKQAERNWKSQTQEAAILRRMEQLTPREREVMEHVVQGRSSKDIARRLDISPKTVDIHRGRILEKLGASSVAHLIHLTAPVLS